jgi:hypothetical protein
VGRGDDWDAKLPRGLESRDSEGELGRYMHHVGTEPRKVLDHVAKSREGPLHIGVEEERNAW